MATYVLCHGGWAGGWQWKEVAGRLRAEGHEVYTPTFTGLGDRSHLLNRSIDLNTYIQDLVMVLRYEDLHDVTLVGYSMSGIVISGAAEQAPERIQRLVYLDAYLVEDGQSFADLVGPEIMGYVRGAAEAYGDGWLVPHNPPDADRRVPMPLAVCYTTIPQKNPLANQLPRTFIYCTRGGEDIGPLHIPIDMAAEKVQNLPNWKYVEIKSGHMPMWTEPEKLVEVLTANL